MTLFAEITPFETGLHETGDGHSLYWERCGRKGGIPVVFLHGGPGSGCTPTHRRYFDPDVYDVVLFDQRGCGRSQPQFSLASNTTDKQIADIESIRKSFDFERWIVMGPSWGSTLALAYAEAHPGSVSGLLVEGVFLASGKEMAWWHCEPGAPNFYPDAFADLLGELPPPLPSKLAAFYSLVKDRMLSEIESGMPVLKQLADHDVSIKILRQSLLYRWSEFETRISAIDTSAENAREDFIARGWTYVAGHSLIEAHYFANGCFLENNQIIRDVDKLASIPMEIIQSRYDLVCPIDAAYQLAKSCPHARLTIIDQNGHAMTSAVFPALQTSLGRLADLVSSGNVDRAAPGPRTTIVSPRLQ